jgi:hypothetical protein
VNSELLAVSCAAASVGCVAVGWSYDYGGDPSVTLAEGWNGRRWTLLRSLNRAGPQDNALGGVSCPSAGDCFAVGDSWRRNALYNPTPLVERWHGRRWEIQRTLPLQNSNLNAVSCWSASGCVAVGDTLDPSLEVPLIERWNGRRWTVQRSPAPTDGSLYELDGISCTSARACIAVGKYGAERWNGRDWTILPVPNRPGPQTSELLGVSCSSPRACIAVGDSSIPEYKGDTNTTLAERWNGRQWTIQSTPNPDTGAYSNNELAGVSCASAHDCVAVGNGGAPPLIEHWNGTRWTVQQAPLPAPGRQIDIGLLSGVSCPSPGTCTAVGRYRNDNAADRTLAEHSNG